MLVGAAARARYGRPLSAAYADLQADPERLGVRPAGVADLCLYPIRHSRARLPPADRVGRPRHLIVFTFDKTHVRILRVLHDGMDVARHVSGER